jgi:DNA/RNA endonuclease G (NUC1)
MKFGYMPEAPEANREIWKFFPKYCRNLAIRKLKNTQPI